MDSASSSHRQGGRRLLGLWDAEKANKVGLLLLFLEELTQTAMIQELDAVDVAVVGGEAEGRLPPEGASREDLARYPVGIPIVDMLSAFSFIRRVWGVRSEHIERFVADSGAVSYPQHSEVRTREYDTTVRIRDHWKKHGQIVPLEVDGPAIDWARAVICKAGPHPRVAVHLKNAAPLPNLSNADMDAWHSFFSWAAGNTTATFILIGDETPDPRFSALSNVAVAHRDHGSCLAGYLGIIQECDLFMGMMSGFCNFALFGRKPYAVFKNPLHHTQVMNQEIGRSDHYSFAQPSQRVLRQHESAALLQRELERMMSIDLLQGQR